jgi:hypothetical protein
MALHEYVDRVARYSMWSKSDITGRSKPMVTWKKCTRSKRIINLRSQNKSLLLKHLDKFYNKKDIPWINLI